MARRLLTVSVPAEKILDRLDPGDLVFSTADRAVYEVYVEAVGAGKALRPLVDKDVLLANGVPILTVEDVWQTLQRKYGYVLLEDK